ncbi:MAG: SIS domain-containing protein [Erysipelotrichaceae bacterium]|jgi:uncharacterized phosphosugar-binding protein|nr:SIS domain-containing protein [Erysipelotrichaceae bacterium]
MSEFAYVNRVEQLFKEVIDTNRETIKALAKKFAENIESDHMIHTFGTGHSHITGIEMFGRAGGLANVNAMLDPDVLTSNGERRSGALERLEGLADIIYDQYKIEKGDIMVLISNSGRNACPIEMAMRAKKEGVYTIAITNLKQSQASQSRHSSGKRLFEVVDVVLDNCVDAGDAMMTVGNISTGPGSTLSSCLLVNTIVYEALKIVNEKGLPLPVLASQNVDGNDNEALMKKYEGRIKYL